MAASSITHTSNTPAWLTSLWAAPAFVHRTTCACAMISSTALFSRSRTSFLRAPSSRRSDERWSFHLPNSSLPEPFLGGPFDSDFSALLMSERASLASIFESDRCTCTSRVESITEVSTRAGCPTRTMRRPAASNLSAKLSTAIFDGAIASTFWPAFTHWTMNSTTVVVLPVPGGPWMSATSEAANAKSIACSCGSFRFLFVDCHRRSSGMLRK
mmetsp:Transcript_94433/g.152335  ORF Transcript_94433/g.152335 Transcript_94433/m.152335 type:complete len:214 (-) Transcript_94433:329-970(-)